MLFLAKAMVKNRYEGAHTVTGMFGEKGDFLVGNSSLVIMESGRFDDMDSNVKRTTMASRSLGAQYFFCRFVEYYCLY